MEIEKNWNKFTFKKLGIIFCLFLFGVVTFISGNLTQINATSSSTVLPVAKGGTGSNSASGAATNILCTNYANYSGILPVAKGGTGGNNALQAQRNLQIGEFYQYPFGENVISYIRVSAVKINNTSNGKTNQTIIISGIYPFGGLGVTAMLETSGRSNTARLTMLTPGTCTVWLYSYDENNIRYYYVTDKREYRQTTSVRIIQSDSTNPAFVPNLLTTLPSGSKEVVQATCRS
jgi:hypothetical protein